MHAMTKDPSNGRFVGGPVPLASRQGRHKQRYGEEGERLVAGCIPVRYKEHLQGPDAVEVLMISRSSGKGWVFPKGGWEDDEPLEAAAERETVEEAGVRGFLEKRPLGPFSFRSGKEAKRSDSHQGRCVAHMFVLRVAEELDVWPEQDVRQRTWFSLQEANSVCCHGWMRDALKQWVQSQGWSTDVLDGGGSNASTHNGI